MVHGGLKFEYPNAGLEQCAPEIARTRSAQQGRQRCRGRVREQLRGGLLGSSRPLASLSPWHRRDRSSSTGAIAPRCSCFAIFSRVARASPCEVSGAPAVFAMATKRCATDSMTTPHDI